MNANPTYQPVSPASAHASTTELPATTDRGKGRRIYGRRTRETDLFCDPRGRGNRSVQLGRSRWRRRQSSMKSSGFTIRLPSPCDLLPHMRVWERAKREKIWVRRVNNSYSCCEPIMYRMQPDASSRYCTERFRLNVGKSIFDSSATTLQYYAVQLFVQRNTICFYFTGIHRKETVEVCFDNVFSYAQRESKNTPPLFILLYIVSTCWTISTIFGTEYIEQICNTTDLPTSPT